ncbi:MAG: hypothetical protein ACO3EZ_04845 [Prochlorotrichaceae cyanobacterium]
MKSLNCPVRLIDPHQDDYGLIQNLIQNAEQARVQPTGGNLGPGNQYFLFSHSLLLGGTSKRRGMVTGSCAAYHN